MKTPVLAKITSLCLLVGLAASVTRADVLTWDPLLNSGGGGPGIWNLNTTANWYNGSGDVQWKDNSPSGTNTAIFAGTSGTVTLANALSASNLQFTASGYTISGASTLTLGAGGIDTSTLGSGTTTIGVPLSLPNGQQAWQVAAGSASTLAVNGTVTHNAGASVDFAPTGIKSTSLNNDATGILGAWATTGNSVSSTTTGDWAANDGSGNIITYAGYTVVSSTSNSSPSLTGSSTQNWLSGDPTGAANFISTITGSATINTLNMQGDVVVAEGATVTLGDGGLIMRGVSRWLIDNNAFNIGTATLLSGLPTGEFFVHTPNGQVANNGGGGNWRIWPQIKDNGAVALKLIKDGPGCVILQNTNTYTGGTFINKGILIAGGESPSVGLEPVTLGSGSVTVGPNAILEFGYGTTDATRDYYITNNVILNGGKCLADDGHQHLSASINVVTGGTLGSTYDGAGSGSTGNKALYIDGVVSGSGPLTLQQAVDAGDNDRYGNGGGNPYNSSVVIFTNANTYSGTITVVPYVTGSGAGSYVCLNSSSTLQFATLNLANNTGGHRYAGLNGLFSPLVFETGIGSATIANLAGTADIILNGFNENTYQVTPDGVTLTLGNSTSTAYSGNFTGAGGLTKVGNGTLTLSGQNTFTGNTTVSGGTLALTGSWLASSNIVIATGRTLDASALSPVTMTASQSLQSDGTLNGSVNTTAGSSIYAGGDGTYGTNHITGGLTLVSGALAALDVGTTASGANDRVNVDGTLTANNNVIHLKAPSTSASLDTADYVLFSSPSAISGAFFTFPAWDVAPANAPHYTIVTSGNTVTLHYSSTTTPSGAGTATPSTARPFAPVMISVVATNGSADTVTGVTVDTSSIGGSAALALVNSGGNVWTNSTIVASTTSLGSKTLVATIIGSDALEAFANIPLTIIAGYDVWNGAGPDNNFSTALNWTNDLSPSPVGDSLQFSGSTQLTPNVDQDYTIGGILFTNAGAFNIGSATANTLTFTNGTGIVNRSANIQTISAPIALAVSPTVAATSNDIVLSGTISDGPNGAMGLAKTGNHTLTLSGSETYSGATTVSGGTLNITGTSGSAVNSSSVFVGSSAGKSTLNLADPASLTAFYLLLGNVTNSVGVVNQTGGTLTVNANSGFDNLSVGNVAGGYGYYGASGGSASFNGICIGGEANLGGGASFSSPGGNGIMEINGGAVQDVGWVVLARQNAGVVGPSTGILNVYSGSLTYAGGGIVGPWDTGEKATINILGGSVTSVGQGVRLGNTGFSGILNLNGGLLEASDISGYNGPSYTIVTNGQLNFNGGTLQANAGSPDFIRVTTATIFSGGATIDNNSFATVTVNQPLLAPTGNGVHGITSFTPGAGYIAPPIVTVVNGAGDVTGTGATAIAQINPATGTVTNIIITCPGVNYTATPTFTLSGGGATTAATITGAAPTANTSGGLTSIGAGILELTANCTYTGNTTVGAGILELLNPVLAAGTTVVVSNNAIVQLDFAGTNFVSGLVLNGVNKPQGAYNAGNSAPFITGSGTLVVGTAPIASNPTNITFSVISGAGTATPTVSLSWPADHLGWILQQATNVTGSWTDIPNTATVTSTNIQANPAVPRDFYRLRHP